MSLNVTLPGFSTQHAVWNRKHWPCAACMPGYFTSPAFSFIRLKPRDTEEGTLPMSPFFKREGFLQFYSFVGQNLCKCVFRAMFVRVCMCVCLRLWLYVCVCVFDFMCACVCVCLCVCGRVCTCTSLIKTSIKNTEQTQINELINQQERHHLRLATPDRHASW